jgi:hypothetical protein
MFNVHTELNLVLNWAPPDSSLWKKIVSDPKIARFKKWEEPSSNSHSKNLQFVFKKKKSKPESKGSLKN